MPIRKLHKYGISYLPHNYFLGNQKKQLMVIKLLSKRIFNQEFASVLYD